MRGRGLAQNMSYQQTTSNYPRRKWLELFGARLGRASGALVYLGSRSLRTGNAPHFSFDAHPPKSQKVPPTRCDSVALCSPSCQSPLAHWSRNRTNARDTSCASSIYPFHQSIAHHAPRCPSANTSRHVECVPGA
jgi:hypothetical protein